MRGFRAHRVDGNHSEIVGVFRELQLSVADTHEVGGGFPDAVAACQGVCTLVEIKDGRLPPSRRALTDDEAEFHRKWRGPLVIVESIDDAIRLAKRMRMVAHLANTAQLYGRVSQWEE